MGYQTINIHIYILIPLLDVITCQPSIPSFQIIITLYDKSGILIAYSNHNQSFNLFIMMISQLFEPSQRNYLKFQKVNDAIEGLPYHHYILSTLPQRLDFSSLAIAYNQRNYDGIKWKPGTANIVINHWLNHLEHPDNVATCSRTVYEHWWFKNPIITYYPTF